MKIVKKSVSVSMRFYDKFDANENDNEKLLIKKGVSFSVSNEFPTD